MYYCTDCGEYFDEKDENAYRYEVEYHSELGSEAGHYPDVQNYLVCPYCGSEEWEEADECELCGEPFHGAGFYCKDCIATVAKNFQQFLEGTYFEIGQGDMVKGIDHIKTIVAEELL